MIISRTPFRISFFGGGTDYPAWFARHGGAVLATTIDKYCYISCRYLPPFFEHNYRIVYSKIENTRTIDEIAHPAVRGVLNWMNCDRGLEIHHDGDVPARSGVGSSSSFTVGLINALTALSGRYISKEALARQAIHLEQDVIKEAVGSQDQVSAAFGGFNRIEFMPDGSFQVSPIILAPKRMEELQDSLMLFFTGFARTAAEVAQTKIDNFGERVAELTQMRLMVDEAIELLQDDAVPLFEFGRMLDRTWKFKRSLSNKVSTPEIDSIYAAALSAGAAGGKLIGAGGGGFILLFVPPQAQEAVKKSLAQLIQVPFRFETSGSRIVLYQPSGLA